MRIVHLLDTADLMSTPSKLAFVAQSFERLSDVEQHLYIIGPKNLARAARSLGLIPGRNVSIIPTPFRKAHLAFPSLRRHLKNLAPIDIIHNWSVACLSTAIIGLRHPNTVTTITSQPDRKTTQWLRVLNGEAKNARHQLLPISNTIARELLSAGINESAVTVVRPAIDLSMADHQQRDAIRARWREQLNRSDAADEQVRFLAPLSDPPGAINASDMALSIALAEDSRHDDDTTIALVLPPDQKNSLRARNMLNQLNRPNHVVIEPLLTEPWKVLPACDITLAFDPNGAGLSTLWAMACNVPIISEATYACAEILEDHHSALLANPPQPQQIAHRIRQLLDDPRLAYQLRDTARHEAFSFFARSNYCQNMSTVYKQLLASEPIELPGLQSTGGLRFTGRA